MSKPVDLREFVAGFLVEADDHLRSARTNLVIVDEATRKGEASPRAVRELFRSLHTLKGLAAMIGIDPIVDLAHVMEAVLRAADRATGRLSAPAVEHLIAGSAAIEARVRALAEGRAVPPAPPRLVAALAQLEHGAPAAVPPGGGLALPPELADKLSPSERTQLGAGLARGDRALRVDFVPTPERAEQGLSITTVRERVGAIAEIVKVVPLSLPRSAEAPGGLAFVLLVLTTAADEAIAAAAAIPPEAIQPLSSPASPPPPPRPSAPSAPPAAPDASPSSPPFALAAIEPGLGDPEVWPDEVVGDGRLLSSVVRVTVERLDDAMEKLSALIVTRFRFGRAIAALASAGADVRALRQIEGEHARQIRDLRASILKLRMVSARELLEPLPLILHGLRAATGKAVRLEINAGRAELDKAVAERILPAIVHLVRNAVDHGIEAPAARVAAGKPEEGVVTITCVERSNTRLELSVSDDGGGIDRLAVAAHARAAGREAPTTDAGLLDLLTLAGLSTRAEATTTSGRGLGMNIVKRTAEELGGELLLRTQPGAGSTFVLRIPLTVTIVDVFTFESGAQTFVVPVAMVEEIIDVDPAKVVEGPGRGRERSRVSLIEHRGEVVPLVDLCAQFSLPERIVARPKAIVVRRHGAPFAFRVERLMGQQEIVVRPLQDPLVKAAAVPGVTDLGDGRPTLVLDLVALSGSLGAPGSPGSSGSSGGPRSEVNA